MAFLWTTGVLDPRATAGGPVPQVTRIESFAGLNEGTWRSVLCVCEDRKLWCRPMNPPAKTARITAGMTLAIALTTGCSSSSGESAKDAGKAHDAASDGNDLVGATRTYAPTMTAVYGEILVTKCAQPFCHLGAAGSTPIFMDKESSYHALVNMPAGGTKCADSGATLVVPGQPDQSLLYRKIERPSPMDLCGDPMPGGGQAQLDDGGIEQIRSWIAQGALDN